MWLAGIVSAGGEVGSFSLHSGRVWYYDHSNRARPNHKDYTIMDTPAKWVVQTVANGKITKSRSFNEQVRAVAYYNVEHKFATKGTTVIVWRRYCFVRSVPCTE